MTQLSTEGRQWSGQDYAARIIQAILFLTLVGSVIYIIIKLVTAPDISADAAVRQKSDYVLMLVQSSGGLIVMFLPRGMTGAGASIRRVLGMERKAVAQGTAADETRTASREENARV